MQSKLFRGEETENLTTALTISKIRIEYPDCFVIGCPNEFHKGVYWEFGMTKIALSEKFDYRFHSTNRISHLRNQIKVIDNYV